MIKIKEHPDAESSKSQYIALTTVVDQEEVVSFKKIFKKIFKNLVVMFSVYTMCMYV